MANAKTVMVLCNILQLSKSLAHNKKKPQNNQRGTTAVRQSYFKRFSYFPQLFLTSKTTEQTRIDICSESYRSIIKSRHWKTAQQKICIYNCPIV